MRNVRLIHLREPLLSFGYNQKSIDPRDGITLFGPYTRKDIKFTNIGIIGTYFGRSRLIEWLKSIEKPVYSKEEDFARPFFPGIEAAFEFSLNLSAVQELDIDKNDIIKYLKYQDSHQRVYNLVNLFADKLIRFKREEEIPVVVWFVVIPDEVYTYGRPKSKIPPSEDNIKIGLKSKYSRNSRALFLFSEDQKLQEAYQYEVNFHNQLKTRLLEDGIITQIIKESTIAYREIFTKRGIEIEEIFDSAKAWSISTTLYYKSGGLPWKLGSVRKGVSYVGLVYKRIDTASDEKTACCAAQMFLDSGDGMVFRGNVGPWYNPKIGEFHLSKESAKELIEKALKTFDEKNEDYPKEIFIHAKTYFNDEEWEGFEEAARDKSKVIGVRIRDDRVFKLYRDYAYPILRGMALVIDEREAFLWTKGFIPRIQTVMGLETPNPLSVEIVKGEADIVQVCKDILSLTKLNYNTCIYGDGVPVTLKFADLIGEILTAGPTKEIGVLTFKHYI
ncbi:MAG: hypothetical protein IH874_05995 [Candidatus Dadabacteria bacterium]|nr:hypothetical protein [Candidatus Dadabacteria bacterium]